MKRRDHCLCPAATSGHSTGPTRLARPLVCELGRARGVQTRQTSGGSLFLLESRSPRVASGPHPQPPSAEATFEKTLGPDGRPQIATRRRAISLTSKQINARLVLSEPATEMGRRQRRTDREPGPELEVNQSAPQGSLSDLFSELETGTSFFWSLSSRRARLGPGDGSSKKRIGGPASGAGWRAEVGADKCRGHSRGRLKWQAGLLAAAQVA